MNTRRIGMLEVSVVGLGCNNFGGRLDGERTSAVVDAAIDSGVTFFDTADIYGDTHSEELLGQALGSRRDHVVVATKFGVPYADHEGGGSPAYIRRAVHDSLRRLGTDHIDLYQLHFPDDRTPIADTLGALAELVREGLVREVGCSNVTADQLRAADRAGTEIGVRFASVQNEYSILHREPEGPGGVLEVCAELGVAFLPYFPLANGLLTGKYRPGMPPPEGSRIGGLPAERAAGLLREESLDTVAALEAAASDAGISLVDLAVGWLLARHQVASVIAGATSAEQVRMNARAGGVEISEELAAHVDRIAPA
ncbi:MAG: aldo/keto reductase [Actinomycetota bacterium]|jgi:aryl-alcohol dehydrogenase-like predicted oxidoreductase|nr:aldo/keto reductase [Actinomycetota bacterium]